MKRGRCPIYPLERAELAEYSLKKDTALGQERKESGENDMSTSVSLKQKPDTDEESAVEREEVESVLTSRCQKTDSKERIAGTKQARPPVYFLEQDLQSPEKQELVEETIPETAFPKETPSVYGAEKDDLPNLTPASSENTAGGLQNRGVVLADKSLTYSQTPDLKEETAGTKQARSPVYFFRQDLQSPERQELEEKSIPESTFSKEMFPAYGMEKTALPASASSENTASGLQNGAIMLADNSLIKAEDKAVDGYGNCILIPSTDRHYVGRDGMDDPDRESEIMIRVFLKGVSNQYLGEITIPYSGIPGIIRHVQKKFPQVIFTKAALSDRLVENTIRMQMESVPVEKYCIRAGWNFEDGKWKYLFNGCTSTQTDLSLPWSHTCDKTHLIQIWNTAFGLYRDRNISRMLMLYVFSGITFKLFESAGYPPRFLLFLTGKTGSMKTSVSKVLYTQLARNEYREQPRRIDMDTGTSFERGLVDEGYDTVTLFDDFAPPKTSGERNILKDNFEKIVRMVGDGSTKSRSNRRLENCRGEGVHGTVVITGEIMGDGLSSNLRCLYCNLEKELVNLEALSWLQKLKYGICTLVKHFSDYAGTVWSTIFKYIQDQYPLYRRQIEARQLFKHQRSSDRYVYFMVLAGIVQDFLHLYCGMNSTDLSDFFEGLESSVIVVLSASEASAEDYDPVKNFMQAFVKLINLGQIKIAPKKFEAEQIASWDGFADEEYIYVLEQNMYSKVRENLINSLIPFYLNLKDTKRMLAEEGFSVSCPNGKGKKTYSARINIAGSERKIDFIKFSRTKINEFFLAMNDETLYGDKR